MKILVVDDSTAIRKIIRRELEKAKYTVVEAEDGADALRQIVLNGDIDLVTLDIQMPVMDGFRTCEELRKEKYKSVFAARKGRPLHILFVTGEDSMEDRRRGLELGATDFIGKHFVETELVAAVNRILKPSKKLENLRALIVDDSETYLEIIAQTLNQQGVHTEKATGGRQAFEILTAEHEKIDMIVTDYLMPDMDGLELTRKIRQLGLSELPVIILSAASDKVTQIDLFKAGANDYITKPFIKEELLARLTVHLETVQLNRKLKRAVLDLKDRNRAIIESKEAIEKKNSEQKELLHVLCHDLSNPFGSIISSLEMIRLYPAQRSEFDPFIEKAANNGLEIIDLVRKMRALDENKMKWVLEAVDIKKIILESYMIIKNKFTAKGIALEINVPENIMVMAELTSLKSSVLNNIFTNAVKFSFPGSSIRVSVAEDPDDSDRILLSIKDSGVGMSPVLLNDIFNINKATSRPGTNGEEGTGFGMPLVKKFVEAYGGEIELCSKDKKTSPNEHGTEVLIYFQKASAPAK